MIGKKVLAGLQVKIAYHVMLEHAPDLHNFLFRWFTVHLAAFYRLCGMVGRQKVIVPLWALK